MKAPKRLFRKHNQRSSRDQRGDCKGSARTPRRYSKERCSKSKRKKWRNGLASTAGPGLVACSNWISIGTHVEAGGGEEDRACPAADGEPVRLLLFRFAKNATRCANETTRSRKRFWMR